MTSTQLSIHLHSPYLSRLQAQIRTSHRTLYAYHLSIYALPSNSPCGDKFGIRKGGLEGERKYWGRGELEVNRKDGGRPSIRPAG